jgi:hypothetical protein
MNDALQDSEKVELEDEVPKTSVSSDEEPDTATLAAVAREEKEKDAPSFSPTRAGISTTSPSRPF